jgi:P4 family phage/plasmid primase-like protien
MPSQDYINLSNGLYNRKIGRLEPHTPDHLSQVQLPISFDEAATCPGLTRFLEEVFPKDSSILAYEILGYLATTDTWLKRAVFLKGLQHSGKSTFCQLIHCFLGDRNITAHSLQHLTSNRFGLAGLHGKLANVLPDLPPARVDDSSIFKMITGNDHMVTGENKYERPFQFWMFCRLVFSANEFLQSADQTDAYLGRWLVLLFPNQFALNRTFLETLATPEELSGLFNLAMQAYRDVVVRGDFTNNEATQQGTELLKESLVPVIAFLKECCDVSNPKSRTNCTDLYQAFCGWCSQTGRRRPSDRTFYAQMRQHFPQGTEVKTDGNRVWAHLTLNDEGEQALEYFRRRERVGQ